MGRLCYYLPKENKSNKKRKKDYYEQEVKMDAHTKEVPPWRYPIKVLLILNLAISKECAIMCSKKKGHWPADDYPDGTRLPFLRW